MKANEKGKKTKLINLPKWGRKAMRVFICAIALCFKLIRDPLSNSISSDVCSSELIKLFILLLLLLLAVDGDDDSFSFVFVDEVRSLIDCFKIEFSIMFIEMGKEWVASPEYQAMYFLLSFERSPPIM